jgi:arsenite methyltransferase
MPDKWAAWLLEHRFGSDEKARRQGLARLGEVRDKVLAGARIRPGDTVLDVGCGDGLLGVTATELVGESGTVIFSDISAELLDRCRAITADLPAAPTLSFVHSGLPALGAIAPDSVDVVLTRSVLIYVREKAAAFHTFHRVLRPGGRLSIFEPINRFGWPEPDSQLWGFDITGLEEVAAKVKTAYRANHPDGADPMVDFDERDLFALAETAGFTEIHLDYRADLGAADTPEDLEVFLRMSPNPLVPTNGEILGTTLTPAERSALLARLTPQFGAGTRRHRSALAYLTARR